MPEPTHAASGGTAPPATSPGTRTDSLLLQTTALRYAAGELDAVETGAFEDRLATDQHARDALSEAVRLSAAALGQAPPTPHRSFHAAIRERLIGWCPSWLARRAYRGHPLAWAGVGATIVAACTVIGLVLAQPDPVAPAAPLDTTQPTTTVRAPSPITLAPEPRAIEPKSLAVAPYPRSRGIIAISATVDGDLQGPNSRSVAEIWADLSTPDHVEKAHDEELRWRQKLREIGTHHPGRPNPGTNSASIDAREP